MIRNCVISSQVMLIYFSITISRLQWARWFATTSWFNIYRILSGKNLLVFTMILPSSILMLILLILVLLCYGLVSLTCVRLSCFLAKVLEELHRYNAYSEVRIPPAMCISYLNMTIAEDEIMNSEVACIKIMQSVVIMVRHPILIS